MKKIIIAILLLTSLLGITAFHPGGETGKIEVLFNHQLNFNDIVKIKLDLSQRGIVVNYSQLGFDETGHLESIAFSVDCRDGFSGMAYMSDHLYNQTRFGFIRDYGKDAKIPFAVGSLQ